MVCIIFYYTIVKLTKKKKLGHKNDTKNILYNIYTTTKKTRQNNNVNIYIYIYKD